MKIESFQNKISENWIPVLKDFIESPECDKIYKYLRERSKEGARILPESTQTWKPFNLCKYEDLKVCIIGDFSLKNFYTAINWNIYPGEQIEACEDLSFLGLQGVLILPNSLTREEESSHEELWMVLYVYLIEKIFNLQNNGIIYILIGEGQKYNWCISEVNSHILYADLKNTNAFSQANKIIEGNNGKNFCIHWDNKYFQEEINNCPFNI